MNVQFCFSERLLSQPTSYCLYCYKALMSLADAAIVFELQWEEEDDDDDVLLEFEGLPCLLESCLSTESLHMSGRVF